MIRVTLLSQGRSESVSAAFSLAGWLAVLAGAALTVACGASNPAPAPQTSAVAVTARDRDSVLTPCSANLVPPSAPLRRLGIREYQHTLGDLFAGKVLRGVLASVQRELNQLPIDGEATASFSRMDARLSQRHVTSYVNVAEALSRAVLDQQGALEALAGSCAQSATVDAACFAAFVRDFGRQVFRRPLTDSEIERWHALQAGSASASAPSTEIYQRVLAQLLASPQFLFHWEWADSPARAEGRDVSSYELASRLAYHFWETLPDAELLAAADSGALQTDAGYRQQVERLVGHQRARATWYRFFREWLNLDNFGEFALDDAFNNFVGNVAANSELHQDAVWEVEQLIGHFTFEVPGSLEDLFTTELILTRSPRIAELYEIEPWDGRSRPQRFAPGSRSGLLTRAALLISSSHATNPFKRGAFVRRRLLCDTLEPPPQRPPEALAVPVFDATRSTRARYEAKVEAWECKGCHQLFSPFGYVLERYDALGRYRQSERLLDDAGVAHGDAPIDSAARVTLGAAGALHVQDPVALSRALAQTPELTQCFAKQYFRFSFRRPETPADGCTLNALTTVLAQGGLLAFYRDVALTPAFRGQPALSPKEHP